MVGWRRWITVLGIVNAVCFAHQTVFSYFLAAMQLDGRQPNQARFFEDLATKVAFLGTEVQSWLRGQSPFASKWIALSANFLPQIISSVAFVMLLAVLVRHRQHLDEKTLRQLFGWAVLFSALALPAFPVQDFWLSLGWGNMIVSGLNPYHTDLTAEFAAPFPLDSSGVRMTYGPMWAILSGVVMWLAGGKTWLGALFFKLLLAGAWVGTLLLICRLLKSRSSWHQCVGVAIFGWMPLSVMQIVGDGHNDVVMVGLMLYWLCGLQRADSIWNSAWLAAAALVKYIVAPLFLLEYLHFRYVRRGKLAAYVPHALVSGALIAAVFGLFYRSPDFFDAALIMRGWHFYEPSSVLRAFETWFGVNLGLLYSPVRLLFPLLAVIYAVVFIRRPNESTFYLASLSFLSAVLFSVVGHVFPWYLTWVMGLAALVPWSNFGRWILGVALFAPFTMIIARVLPPESPEFQRWGLPTLLLYGGSLIWLLAARWLLPSDLASERVSEPSPSWTPVRSGAAG